MPMIRFRSNGTSPGLGPGRRESAVETEVCGCAAGVTAKSELKIKKGIAKDGRQSGVTCEIITETRRFANGAGTRNVYLATKERGRSELRPYNRAPLLLGGGRGFVQAGGHDGVEERHHRA